MVWVVFIFDIPLRIYRSSLHRNAGFLIANYAVGAGLGFFFWTVAARVFPAATVGLASATVSAMGLVFTISGLGLGIGLVRFLPPSQNKQQLVGTALTISATVAVCISAVFLSGLSLWAPKIVFLTETPIVSLIFAVSSIPWVWASLIDQGFVALRKSHFSLLRNIISQAGKLILLLVVGVTGALGIFGVWAAALVVSVVLAFFIFYKVSGFGFPTPSLNIEEFRKMFSFSSANYLAGFLYTSPATVMPLVVTGFLGAEMTAYYYVSWMIATALFVIPTSIGTSYLAESASTPEKRDQDFKRAIKFAYTLTIPLAITIYIFADKILLLFGETYSDNATSFLRLLVLVIPAYAFNHVFIARKNVVKELGWVVGGNIVVTTILFAVTSYGLKSWGLSAIAYGFIAGHIAFLALSLTNTFR